MNTQQHENEIQQRVQAPSPVKEPRWLDVLLTVLGVALALVASPLPWLPWGVPDIIDSGVVFAMVVWPTIASITVGAFLIRSLWALVIVPGAWVAGSILTIAARLLIEGNLTWAGMMMFAPVIALGVVFVLFFAWVGTGIYLTVRNILIWRKQRHEIG